MPVRCSCHGRFLPKVTEFQVTFEDGEVDHRESLEKACEAAAFLADGRSYIIEKLERWGDEDHGEHHREYTEVPT